MKSFIALLMISALATMLLAKDTEPTPTKAKDIPQVASPNQRIEEVFENNHKVIRFHDKSGKKVKELGVGETEIRTHIGKEKVFDRSGLKVNISTAVAEAIESLRKHSGRDIEHVRQESNSARISDNKKYLVLEESRLDFVEYADIKSDSEYAEDPVENTSIARVYNAEGKEILTLNNTEGWNPLVSNTGQFFAVTVGESEGLKILNLRKEILAEVSFLGPTFFSDNDRYILLVDDLIPGGKAAISVFDTKENKFELNKLTIPNSAFKNIEKMNISEDKREITIIHFWDIKTRRVKTEKLQF